MLKSILEWYVYIEDINRKKITAYNIFDHPGFKEDCDYAWERYKHDYVDGFTKFDKAVKDSLRYYFWGKCEWEMILSGWPPCKTFNNKKVSVYDQVRLNWNHFISYVWRFYKYDFE